MSDTKISDLTSYSSPIDTDILPIVDITTGTTKKITISAIRNSMGAVLLDQTTPQTIANGVPLMTAPVVTSGSKDQLVNKEYVDLSVSGIELSEFFSDTASSIGGIYKVMSENQATAAINTSASLGAGADQNFRSYATVTGQPNLTTIVQGQYDVHMHMYKTGTKPVSVYFKLFSRTEPAGIETLIFTTETSTALDTTSAEYSLHAFLDTDVSISTSDRLVLKAYANVGSTGSDITVKTDVGGLNNSHLSIKLSPTVLNNYIKTDQTTPQTIGLTGARLAKLWATDIDCTNAIVASITGNAATVTNGVYTNAANTFNQINPLITPAESWIGPSTTTGVYFKGGKVGIGTTSPNFPLTVTDGSIPEASAVGITGRGISYQGAGSAYFMGRDMTNDIEFIMGTSTVGEAFAGSMTAHDLDFRTGNKRGRIHIVHATGNVGIGIIAPTAKLHLAAGKATASTAPLKFTSGVLNTTAGAGAVEFLTDKYYGTITTGAARKTFAFLESPIFTTPTLGVATATRIGVGVAADATRVFVSAATSAAELPLYERTGGTSNDPLGSVFLLATKTTDMSNGFGVTQVFQIKDDAGVANTIGVVGFVRDGADNTGKYVVRPYALGVQGTDKFTVDSAGHVLLEGVTSTGATGTGKFVFDTSPTLAAPVIKNYTTALAPTYAKGALYFDTTLNKLKVGGATAWETITST